ncbi:MAG: DUF1028 domain-containing protein [Firmicutes bacterium]|nr:DUF1028 domain-containing protein [Bacillota bacterium]
MYSKLAGDFPGTFSIVARDAKSGEFGVAVQSKFLAAAAVVPWARAGVGAIATQARANYTFGPRGMTLLEQGHDAEEVLAALIREDENREVRQVAVLDRNGKAAAFTGKECLYWAGHQLGEGFSCQGNILVGPEVVAAMAKAFQGTSGDLAMKLVAALHAGQAAGGDSRGQQSAGLLVVREGAGFGGLSDQYINLRVDDHPQPIAELERLLDLHRLFFAASHVEKDFPVKGEVRKGLAEMLTGLGYLPHVHVIDGRLETALERLAEAEGLEVRAVPPGWISGSLVAKLRERWMEKQQKVRSGK